MFCPLSLNIFLYFSGEHIQTQDRKFGTMNNIICRLVYKLFFFRHFEKYNFKVLIAVFLILHSGLWSWVSYELYTFLKKVYIVIIERA